MAAAPFAPHKRSEQPRCWLRAIARAALGSAELHYDRVYGSAIFSFSARRVRDRPLVGAFVCLTTLLLSHLSQVSGLWGMVQRRSRTAAAARSIRPRPPQAHSTTAAIRNARALSRNLALMKLAAFHRQRGDTVVLSRSPYRSPIRSAAAG